MKIRIGGRQYEQPTNAGELNELLLKVLGHGLKEMPRDLLRHLTQGEYVTAALGPSCEEGVQDCVSEARRFLARHPELLPRRRTRLAPRKETPGTPVLNEGDLGYARFFSETVAEWARKEPDVARLRSDLLLSPPLSLDAAKTMLLCPACRLMSPRDFRSLGIPLIGHSAEYGDLNDPVLRDKGVLSAVHVAWADGSAEVPLPESFWMDSNPTSAAIGQYGQTMQITVAHGSVLNSVRRVGEVLANTHPWTPVEAALFLLTDEPPFIRPISYKVESSSALDRYNFGRITLAIQPWVAAETVYDAYQGLQLANFRPAPKTCDPEKLELYRFTKRCRASVNHGLTWLESMKAWNATGPKRRYVDYHQFQRDFKRAESWLRKHPYTQPNIILSDQVLNTAQRAASKRGTTRPGTTLKRSRRINQ